MTDDTDVAAGDPESRDEPAEDEPARANPEKTPQRDRIVVLEDVDLEFTVELPGTGPYSGKTVIDGDASLTERFGPHDEEWTATPDVDGPGTHEFRMVAEGPSDNAISDLPDLGPAEVDPETGAYAAWTVQLVDPAELSAVDTDTAATLLESTVGLFTSGELPLSVLERLREAVHDADREDLRALPEYEVLLATISANQN